MERIIQGRSATLSHTFYSDATATDPSPDSASVSVVRQSDGSAVTTGSVDNTGTGVATVTIPASSNTLLDTYTMTWTATFGGEPQTFEDTVEVAGGFLFSISEARSVSPLADEDKYPTSAIIAMRTLVEQSLEDVCGVAFVPRYSMASINGPGDTAVSLPRTLIHRIRSAAIAGTPVDTSTLTVAATDVYRTAGWPRGTQNITIGYEHGYATPPARVAHAALRLAKRWLIEGPVDDRATTMSNDAGTFSLVTPGMRGAMFDIPEVNAVTQQYSLTALVA